METYVRNSIKLTRATVTHLYLKVQFLGLRLLCLASHSSSTWSDEGVLVVSVVCCPDLSKGVVDEASSSSALVLSDDL